MDMNHGSMPMQMYFQTNVMNTILFKEWHTMDWHHLLGSCIGIAVIAALYEGLKVGREYLDMRMSHSRLPLVSPTSSASVSAPGACECGHTDGSSDNTIRDSTTIDIGEVKANRTREWPAILSTRHLIQTGLHFIQLWIGFCLMLIFMTYNVYICIAVTVGGAIGYFCFAWMRSKWAPQSDYLAPYKAECCN